MRSFVHPNVSRLREWLLTGESDKVGLHVEHCDRCADRLEQIDREEREAAAPPVEATATSDATSRASIADALSSMLAAPDDLGERVVRGIELRERAEQELALVAGLMAVGVDTAKLLSAPTDEWGPAESADDPSAATLSHRPSPAPADRDTNDTNDTEEPDEPMD